MIHPNYVTSIQGVDKRVNFLRCWMDTSAVSILGLEVVRDNKLAGDGVWLTKTGLRKLGLTEDSWSFRNTETGYEHKIKGIIREFIMGTVTNKRDFTSDVDVIPLFVIN